MKKRTTNHTEQMEREGISRITRKEARERAAKESLTIGLDVGDRNSSYCILGETGDILLESALPTTQAGLGQVFEGMGRCRIALEVGTHSPWMSRYLSKLGHEVIVANARNVAYITRSTRKNDRLDARKLAQLARIDAELLSPIRHRSEAAQADLAVLRMRDLAVRERTKLVTAVRAMAKSLGDRLKPCAPEAAGVHLLEGRGEAIGQFAQPALTIVETLNAQITEYDRRIAAMEARYPQAERLQKVYGVGRLIALAFLLTLDDAERFAHSRDVGPYLGFRPKLRDSGKSQPELGISKEGDELLRRLLVQAAQTTLRKNAPDSDIRRWGLAMQEQAQGEPRNPHGRRKGTKKKVVVAVARKIGVLLHRLWVSGEEYDPQYNRRQQTKGASQPAQKAAA